MRYLLLFTLLLSTSALGQISVEKGRNPLDTPGIRYVLESTPQGQALLDLFPKTWANLKPAKRIKLVLDKIAADRTSRLYRHLRAISKERMIYHSEFDPLLDWDKAVLNHAAQDYLNFERVGSREFKFKGLVEVAKPITYEQADAQTQAISRRFDSELILIDKRNPEDLRQRANQLFAARGVSTSESNFSRFPATRILPDNSSNLSRLALGLEAKLGVAELVYAPSYLVEKKSKGAFSISSQAIAVSHQAILDDQVDETIVHEILHAKFQDQLKKGITTHFHGTVSSTKNFGYEPKFSYIKSNSMKFEEVATHAMGLHRAADRIALGKDLLPVERNWYLALITSIARQGELASAYSEKVIYTALEKLKSGQLEKFSFGKMPDVPQTVAAFSFKLLESGLEIKVQLPLPEAGTNMSDRVQILKKELEARLRLYDEMRERFGAVSKIIAAGVSTDEEVRKVMEAARAPRSYSRPYASGHRIKLDPTVPLPKMDVPQRKCFWGWLRNVLKI